MKKIIALITLAFSFNSYAYYNGYCYRGDCYDTPEGREAARREAVALDRLARLEDPYHVSHINLEDY